MIKLPKRDKLRNTKNWVRIPFALTLPKLLTAHIFLRNRALKKSPKKLNSSIN